jgi:hypothetical protein
MHPERGNTCILIKYTAGKGPTKAQSKSLQGEASPLDRSAVGDL